MTAPLETAAEGPAGQAALPLPKSVGFFGALRAAGLAGDGAWMIATTWVLVNQRGPGAVGLFLAALAVIGTLLMTPAARVTDKVGVRRTLLASDAASCGIALSAGVSLALGVSNVDVLVISSLALAAVTSFYGPASSAFLQLLAPPDRLSNAMGIRQLSTSAGTILGSVLGGLMIAHGSLQPIVVLNALTFAIGWVGVTLIKSSTTTDSARMAHRPDDDEEPGLLTSLRHIWADTVMRWTLARAMIVNVLGMTLTGVILISRVKEDGHSGALLGALEAAMAVGLMVTGLIVSKWVGPKRPGFVAGVAFVAAACFVTLEISLVHPVLSVACAFGLGCSLVIGGAFGDTIMLKRADPNRLVFFHAVMMTVSTVAVPFGQALGGVLMAVGNGRVVGIGTGFILIVATALCLSVRPLREAT